MAKRILVCLVLVPLAGFCIPMARKMFETKGFICYLLYFAGLCAGWLWLILCTDIVIH